MEPVQLSIEQEFNIRLLSEQVKDLTKEQAQEMCVEIFRQSLIKESLYKGFLMQQLGVNP